MFEQVRVPDSRKGNDYIVTAEVNKVDYDDREGPYFFVQSAESGKGRRIKKANFNLKEAYSINPAIYDYFRDIFPTIPQLHVFKNMNAS